MTLKLNHKTIEIRIYKNSWVWGKCNLFYMHMDKLIDYMLRGYSSVNKRYNLIISEEDNISSWATLYFTHSDKFGNYYNWGEQGLECNLRDNLLTEFFEGNIPKTLYVGIEHISPKEEIDLINYFV